MHQRDEIFFAILNKMQTINQRIDDLLYINARCVLPAPKEPTFPYLFYRNKHVVMHNNHMLLLMSGDEIMIGAINVKEDKNHGNMPCHQHTTTFPTRLVLKFNKLVEIYACNYDS
jgi:hypothetical protein